MTRRVSHRVFRRLKDSKGTSLVEAALITPLLLLLTFGICEFASLFYVYLALENGVSQATRFGITGNVTGVSTREDSIRAAMRDATPTLTLPDSAFTFSHMPIGGAAWTTGSAGSTDELERVTVDVQLEDHDAAALAILYQRRDQLLGELHNEERKQVPMSLRSLRRLLACDGQSVVEIALILPLVVVLVLGVVEFSYALLDAHVVTKRRAKGRT